MKSFFPVLPFFFFVFLSLHSNAQKVKISNNEGRVVGEFTTDIFKIQGSETIELGSLKSQANFTDLEKGEIVVRLRDLVWIDQEFKKKTLSIRKASIRIKGPDGMKPSGSNSKYRLLPNDDKSADISFEVTKNGDYRIEFPFSAGKIDGKIARTISVSGFSSSPDEEVVTSSPTNEAENEALQEEVQKIEARIEKSHEEEIDPEPVQSFELDGTEPGYDLEWLPGNKIRVNLTNFEVEKVETLSDPTELEIVLQEAGKLEIEYTGSREYFVKLRGSQGLLLVEFDNSLEASLNQGETSLELSVKGGISPYSVEFLKDDEEFSSAEARFTNLLPDEEGKIIFAIEELSRELGGYYSKLILSDNTTEVRKELDLDLLINKSRGVSNLMIFGILGLVVLGGVLIFMSQRKRKQKREEYKERARIMRQIDDQKMREEKNPATIADDPPAGAPKKITIQRSKPETTPLGFSKVDKSPKTSGNMKIKWREAKGGKLEAEAFAALLQDQKTAKLELSEHWADTTVKNVYLSEACIKDLGSFLKTENLNKMQSELQGAIPEVGGFLMGNHSYSVDNKIDVVISKFVPFVPEYHDVFKIEIGTQTLVQELGDAQDNHPNLDVIGWFHTHPGHGLFLSNSDLSVHKHFAQPYQIAMEIDSLTERLDTAFFSRKEGGRMNNVEHRNKGAEWFAWKEIEKI